MPATADQVLDTLARELDIDRAHLQPGARIDTFDVGSLDMVALGLALEERFGASLEQADLGGLATLQDLVDLVLERARPQP